MKIQVTLLEQQKLSAHFENYTILSDQPISNNGSASAPCPFDYFLSSMALCAGHFIKSYCSSRNISTNGISIVQVSDKDEQGKLFVTLKIDVPEHFTEKEREGITRAVSGCSVKKAILQNPIFSVEISNKK